MRILFIHCFIFCVTISACDKSKPDEDDYVINTGQALPSISYLALGDSYTIGEAVDSTQSWPLQLADTLREAYNLQVNNCLLYTSDAADDA